MGHGRRKGSKNYKKGEEPWLVYGLSEGAYWSRLKRGIPLDAKLKCGRKPDIEFREALEKFGRPESKDHGRFSGRSYENSPEKLDAIREKYRNGITPEILAEMMEHFCEVS